MNFFDSHHNEINAFPGSSVSDWTVDLNNWNTTREYEDTGRREETADKARKAQNPYPPFKGKQTDLDTTDLDNINLEEVEMDEVLTIYENMWEYSASDHLINTPQDFRVGLLLKGTIRRQEKAVDLLGTLCRDVLADWE